MSFRNTFITDYIYSASDETKGANKKVKKVFAEWTDYLHHWVDERGYGYYSGIVKTLDLGCSLEELQLEELVYKLSKVTAVPFRLTVMQESGAVVTYNVEPPHILRKEKG